MTNSVVWIQTVPVYFRFVNKLKRETHSSLKQQFHDPRKYINMVFPIEFKQHAQTACLKSKMFSPASCTFSIII